MDIRRLIPAVFGGAAVIPWYLSTGDTPIFAYDAEAASYEASKVNLANPGTYNAVDTGHIPAWDGVGWTMKTAGGLAYFETGYTPAAGEYTVFMEYLTTPAGNFFGCYANDTFGVMEYRTVAEPGAISHRGKSAAEDTYWITLVANTGKIAISRTYAYNNGLPMTNEYGGNTSTMDALGLPLFVGAVNKFDGAVGCSCKIAKVALYSGNLVPASLAILTNP